MPQIGIIGRQNVGKSTLFNTLIGKRKSISYDTPGVTRDLISNTLDNSLEGNWILTDFPGFENLKKIKEDRLSFQSIEHSLPQIEKFHLLLLVVSIKGLTAFEHDLIKHLRTSSKEVWLIVNFVDDPHSDNEAFNFYELGFSKVFLVSALNKRNTKKLKSDIIKNFSGEKLKLKIKNPRPIKIVLAGKPNAGKSTLFNKIINKEKALISEIAGTTRDAIDDSFIFEDNRITLTDTAGIRKSKTSYDSVEFFSVSRAKTAIRDADIVLFLVDPFEKFDKQNKSLMNLIEQENKPMVLLITKYDKIENTKQLINEIKVFIEDQQTNFWHFPYFFMSAQNNKKSKVTQLLQKSIKLYDLANTKISTSQLNKMLEQIKKNPILAQHSIKVNYITMNHIERRLILFANTNKIPSNIKRYLNNQFQIKLKWEELPILISIKNKKKTIK